MKAFIFDIGETIIHSLEFNFEKGLKRVYDELKKDNHITKSFEEFLDISIEIKHNSYDERNLHHLEVDFKKYLNLLIGITGIKYPIDLDYLEKIFIESVEIIEPIPNIVILFNLIKEKGYPIIALSNSTFSTNTLKVQLTNVGLEPYFDEVFSSCDLLLRKPCKELFQYVKNYITNKFGLCEFYYIGNDWINDITPCLINSELEFIPIELSTKKSINEYSFTNYIDIINYLKDKNIL